MVDVSIIIVSYNVKNLLVDCLNSIINQRHKSTCEIIVVDNNSTDGSAGAIKTQFSKVGLVENLYNAGFTTANNQGIKKSKGRYVLLLNPDTVVLPQALDRMVEFLDRHPEAGAVGCRMWWDKKGRLQRTCSRFPTLRTAFLEHTLLGKLFPNSKTMHNYLLKDWDRDTVQEVDAASGAGLMLRRKTVNEIGMLDENFFMYFEEIDWCFRAKQNGWKVYFIPEAEIIHYSGQSSKLNPKSAKIFRKSMLYFYKKHYGLVVYFILKVILATSSLWSRMRSSWPSP